MKSNFMDGTLECNRLAGVEVKSNFMDGTVK